MRTLIVLFAIAAALLVFIVVVERDTVSDGELAKREGHVLANFIRTRVDELTVEGPQGKVRLVRKPDVEGIISQGIWYVEEPYVSEADQQQVDALLGELEWMDARRKLHDVSAKDRAEFGLKNPKYRVTYLVGREPGQLTVGSESPKGDGTYVATEDPAVAYVIGKDLTEALKQPPESYHTKIMHDGVMVDTSLRFTLRDGDREQQVEKRDGRFWLKGEPALFASQPALAALCDAIDALQAKRYVAEGGGGLAPYGLDKPSWEVRIVRRRLKEGADRMAKISDRFEERELRLRLGAPCAEHEGERYAMVGDDGPIFCVVEAQLNDARAGLSPLADGRLAPLETAAVDRIVIEGLRPSTGKLRLEKGEPWTLKSPTVEPTETEQGSVPAMLTAITSATASQDAGIGPVPSRAPAIRVIFSHGASPVLTLELFPEDAGLRVHRIGEDVSRLYPTDLAATFDTSGLAFRKHQVLSYRPESLMELTAYDGKHTQRALRGEKGTFALVDPAPGPADVTRMATLTRMLSGLTATGFEAAYSHPEAFDAGFVELAFELDGKRKTHKLSLHASVAGGYWGRLDGDRTLMALDEDLVRALSEPWLSRTFASPPIDRIEAIRIGGASPCVVVSGSDGFAFESGNGSAEEARRLVDAWAVLRVRGASFGSAGAKIGTPVELELEGQKRTLRVVPDETGDTLYALEFGTRLTLEPGASEALLACPR